MADLIDRQAAIDFIDAGHLCNPNEPRWSDNEVINFLKSRSSASPEQKIEELLPDGTLHLFADVDLSNVVRVLVSQNGTHYVGLYYADGEPEYRLDEWCTDCREYDHEKHCCPRFNRVIRETIEEVRKNAEPERKTGRWIETKNDLYDYFICSECCAGFTDGFQFRFCPNCGAKMKEGD